MRGGSKTGSFSRAANPRTRLISVKTANLLKAVGQIAGQSKVTQQKGLTTLAKATPFDFKKAMDAIPDVIRTNTMPLPPRPTKRPLIVTSVSPDSFAFSD